MSDTEREANLFAMCLLMPESMVRKWVAAEAPAGIDLCDDNFLRKFAKKFQVPLNAAVLRLVDLGILRGGAQ